MNTTYESQRKERLSDVIFDYLQDEDTSPEKLYTDIREEIINALEHFEKYADRCRRARDLITDDFFPTNSDYKEHCYYDSESEGRDFYNNDTHPEISPPDLTDARIQFPHLPSMMVGLKSFIENRSHETIPIELITRNLGCMSLQMEERPSPNVNQGLWRSIQ